SIHVVTTPMFGLARSSSVKPTAFSIDRAPARPGPWVIVALCSFLPLVAIGRSYGTERGAEAPRSADDLVRRDRRSIRSGAAHREEAADHGDPREAADRGDPAGIGAVRRPEAAARPGRAACDLE